MSNESLWEAREPGTPPERLKVLSESPDLDVVEAAAGNPNTPIEALFPLVERFPHAFLQNPIFSLLLLEDTQVVRRMPLPALSCLLSLPEAPPGLVEMAACDPRDEVRALAARHPALSHATREALARSRAPRVCCALAGDPRCPPGLLARLFQENQERRVRCALAENPSTPAEILAQLAERAEQEVRYFVAENPSSPEPVLRALAREPGTRTERGYRALVAGNSGAPPPLLAELAAGAEDLPVQEALAQNPGTPGEVLRVLASSPNAALRWLVAANPAAPYEEIERLSEDPDPEVMAVARARLREPTPWPRAPRPKLRCAARLGLGDRLHQEDAVGIRVWPEGALFLVVDGMGGQSSGYLAAEVATQVIPEHLEGYRRAGARRERPGAALAPLPGAFLAASRAILRRSWHEWYQGLGATAAAILLDAGGVCVAHVGTCRVYRLREDVLSLLTEDHSLANEIKRAQGITAEQLASLDIQRSQNVVTRLLGGQEPSSARPGFRYEELRGGDLYLLCSDGLTSEVSDERIAEILLEKRGSLERCADALVKATEHAESRDNLSLVLVEVGSG